MQRVSAILRQVSSEKVRERAEGRKKLESALATDRKQKLFDVKEYSDLLRASIAYEQNEIKSAMRTHRPADASNALFFKSICKHHRMFGEVSKTKVNELLKHVLTVISEEVQSFKLFKHYHYI